MREFQELVDTHYQPLYRFAYSMAKDPDKAADLVQQTFCIWAQKGHQLRERSKAKTWLFTTLYREFLAGNRRVMKYPETDLDIVDYQLKADNVDAGRSIDAKKAVSVLYSLDETFRAPLALFFVQQHSYKEIAKILDIPMGTVMSRISRGKDLLKKKMREDLEKNSDIVIMEQKRKGSE